MMIRSACCNQIARIRLLTCASSHRVRVVGLAQRICIKSSLGNESSPVMVRVSGELVVEDVTERRKAAYGSAENSDSNFLIPFDMSSKSVRSVRMMKYWNQAVKYVFRKGGQSGVLRNPHYRFTLDQDRGVKPTVETSMRYSRKPCKQDSLQHSPLWCIGTHQQCRHTIQTLLVCIRYVKSAYGANHQQYDRHPHSQSTNVRRRVSPFQSNPGRRLSQSSHHRLHQRVSAAAQKYTQPHTSPPSSAYQCRTRERRFCTL